MEIAMKYLFGAVVCASLIALYGCTKTPETPKKSEVPAKKAGELSAKQEAHIQAAMAKLSDADRALAETQKFCPVGKSRLGLMGKPVRIELEGKVVFLCCDHCEEDARANPKKTLEQVAEFKKK